MILPLRYLFLLLLTSFLLSLSCIRPAGSGQYRGWIPFFTIRVVDTSAIPQGPEGLRIRYGLDLMLHTAERIGPTGDKNRFTGSFMTCSNCHQDAGTKLYSLDLLTSYSRYPQYRPRENRVLNLAERINNCVTRPLNGKPLPDSSEEMKAFLAYFKWLDDQAKGDREQLSNRKLSLVFMPRAADPSKGATLFAGRCIRCHGAAGEGIMEPGINTYRYPPLWGEKSYQSGSSMHRNILLARWLKANMPFDSAAWYKPVLSDEECLDLAAFINDEDIHPRPKPASLDYPDASKKPVDYGQGPFIDTFSERQHTVGPFGPIIRYWTEKGWNPSY